MAIIVRGPVSHHSYGSKMFDTGALICSLTFPMAQKLHFIQPILYIAKNIYACTMYYLKAPTTANHTLYPWFYLHLMRYNAHKLSS
jgi:hypothetical protein